MRKEQIIRDTSKKWRIQSRWPDVQRPQIVHSLEDIAYRKEGQTALSHLDILTTMGGRRSNIMPIPHMRSKS